MQMGIKSLKKRVVIFLLYALYNEQYSKYWLGGQGSILFQSFTDKFCYTLVFLKHPSHSLIDCVILFFSEY